VEDQRHVLSPFIARLFAALRLTGVVTLAVPVLLQTGCTTPSAANIELRKQNQQLREEVASLKLAREGDAATIQSLESKVGTVPTLPGDRLGQLFTTHGLALKRLTGGADLDPARPGDEGLQIYAVPTDQEGQPLKAAGSFTVEAFDLAAQPASIGKWTFDLKQSKDAWNGSAMAYHYALKAIWQTPPAHEDLTVKVTFHDELTGRDFSAQKQIRANLPPTSSSTSGR
jgi:hypothetical protein